MENYKLLYTVTGYSHVLDFVLFSSYSGRLSRFKGDVDKI